MFETVNMDLELGDSQTGRRISPTESNLVPTHEIGSQITHNELLEQNGIVFGKERNGPLEAGDALPDYAGVERLELICEGVTKSLSSEQLESPRGDAATKSSPEHLVSPSEDVKLNSNPEQFGLLPDDASEKPDLEKLGTPVDEAKNPRKLGRRGKRTHARKGKAALISSVDCTRVLRSKEKSKVPELKSQERSKAQETIDISAENVANKEKRRKRKKAGERTPVNEFIKIRNHLRYLLTRISYEKNLIDAYSGEGWKGQSLEKVKLEKELQRAKAEISRRKLKIRDLFQHLDSSCAEGKLPETLFDSEGEIDSEDIFCAKCGSKDLPVDNDIILCDGACERGFHQFCLEPPLLKEDIPPDDEGWLCPGCDCKVDCISLLNESSGTKLSITDNWEKVFPEAATGNKLDDTCGFPSDDSDDDDYDPNSPADDEKVQEDETSSDESDFFSASDDFLASPNKDQYLGLPSDDSEDDDYNPDAPDLDEKIKQEDSSSDFTSESEDFGNRTLAEDEGHMSLGSDPGLGDYALVSGKRHVERLDYKRLHDETYGNVSSDSSDEDYKDNDAPEKQKSNIGRAVLDSKSKARKKLVVKSRNSSRAKSCNASCEPGSSGQINTKSAYKKLGEAVSQGLLESFKENQFPKRDKKEILAKELGITVLQVSKWFENARRSFRCSSRTESSAAEGGQNKGATSSQAIEDLREPDEQMSRMDVTSNVAEDKVADGPSSDKKDCSGGDVPTQNLVTDESQSQKSTTPNSRKRKGKLDQSMDHSGPSMEVTPNQGAQVEPLEAIKSARAQKSRRRSAA